MQGDPGGEGDGFHLIRRVEFWVDDDLSMVTEIAKRLEGELKDERGY